MPEDLLGFGVETSHVKVRQATEADLDDVLRLAHAVQLHPGMDTRRGFLVSALSRKTYAAALSYMDLKENAEHVVFLIAERERKIVGFLLGYNDVYASRKSSGKSEEDIAARYSGSYYVLKQIATESDERQVGVGRALAQRFFTQVRCAYIFSAIVTEPDNPASCTFHRKLDFTPVFESLSRSTNGQTYRNQVWRRLCQ